MDRKIEIRVWKDNFVISERPTKVLIEEYGALHKYYTATTEKELSEIVNRTIPTEFNPDALWFWSHVDYLLIEDGQMIKSTSHNSEAWAFLKPNE